MAYNISNKVKSNIYIYIHLDLQVEQQVEIEQASSCYPVYNDLFYFDWQAVKEATEQEELEQV